MKTGKLIGILVALSGIGVVVWVFVRRSTTAAAPVGGSPAAPLIQTPAPPGKAATIVDAAVKTGTIVAGAIAGGGALAGTATAATAIPAAGALGAGVGGETVAGSVAATQAASATAAEGTAAGSATGGGFSGLGAFFTNPWTIGVGAAIAVGVWIWHAKRNDTKNDREDFAESLGFVSDGTGTQLDHLFAALESIDPVKGAQLRDQALNVIGKHDTASNTAWMHACLQLFGVESYPAAASLPYSAPIEDDTKPLDVGELIEA